MQRSLFLIFVFRLVLILIFFCFKKKAKSMLQEHVPRVVAKCIEAKGALEPQVFHYLTQVCYLIFFLLR